MNYASDQLGAAFVKAVFDTRPGSGYDDLIAERYHFPDRYLPIARQAIGDWIVYREPRRGGGRSGYVAAAFVTAVEADPSLPGHSYARVAMFRAFDDVVGLDDGGRYREARLRDVGSRSRLGVALQGRSVRELAEEDFAAIVIAGIGTSLRPETIRATVPIEESLDPATNELIHAAIDEQKRRVVQILLNRKIRYAGFRSRVCAAYDDTCAITGLRIFDRARRAEVQAAHIWSVETGGPDIVQNGIALTATAHWLFDRHLISLTDDFGLLVSHNRIPSELQGLFAHQLERVHLPRDPAFWPHPAYVRRHRSEYLSAEPGKDF